MHFVNKFYMIQYYFQYSNPKSQHHGKVCGMSFDGNVNS